MHELYHFNLFHLLADISMNLFSAYHSYTFEIIVALVTLTIFSKYSEECFRNENQRFDFLLLLHL